MTQVNFALVDLSFSQPQKVELSKSQSETIEKKTFSYIPLLNVNYVTVLAAVIRPYLTTYGSKTTTIIVSKSNTNTRKQVDQFFVY